MQLRILLLLIQWQDYILQSLNNDRQFIRTEDGKWIDIGLIQDRRETLRKLKKEIQDQVLIAYKNYAQAIAEAEEISKMPCDPKKWWKALWELGENYFAHHCDCKTTALWKKDGNFTTTYAENMELWTDHFTRVLNTERNVDQEVLNDTKSKMRLGYYSRRVWGNFVGNDEWQSRRGEQCYSGCHKGVLVIVHKAGNDKLNPSQGKK